MAAGAALLECVPNFSEGRRKEVIEGIAAAVKSVNGVQLLDVDPSVSANRTVYTFVGGPEDVVEAALHACRVAHQLIDMSGHKGEHPRLGALDVCPFIPVANACMADAVRCANEFARRLAADLHVPVYLYQDAAVKGPHRVSLPSIRAGEYEGLAAKIKLADWVPDYGPAEFVPSWGATVCGARPFLIAYNVNMLSTKEQAHRVALDIREQGRSKDEPGKFKSCRAIGWYLSDENMAQVSINLTDFTVTSMHQVYEECKAISQSLSLAVVGSQLVGLVPLQAMLDSARHYMHSENLFITDEAQQIRLVSFASLLL
ncbi:formimidoyltransferase-cyclodeaminase-like [Sycon ciliatum]|uniref:formimidoyltransferase-cyclodeaminase-like n=1 Tax=Sycon ciliatum TaxID=27933 RepID=UPI0031F65E44